MSTSSDISLGALRIQAKQRSDLENNPAVSDPEWNGYLSNSRKRLYNMLVAAYGNDYFVSAYYNFQLGNSQFYSLPDGTPSFVDENGNIASKVFKLIDVDLQYSASPSGWLTLKRFEEIERNKYAWSNVAVTWLGYTNLRYRLSGTNLMFAPTPMPGQGARIRYIPTPRNLQYMLPGYCVQGSSVIGSMSDTTGVVGGMNCYSFLQNVVPNNTTVLSVTTTTMTLSSNALASVNANTFAMWTDATMVDGISGWDEFVILDSAIKAQIKQEGPSQELMAERQSMIAEIEAMAEGRDAGQAQHVSDALGANSYSVNGYGSDDGCGDF